MITISDTELKDVKIISFDSFLDERGLFGKIYNSELFVSNNIIFNLKEQYYTRSKKGAIRGLHFQLPPFEESKIVYVPHGRVLDIILDLRTNSKTYKKFIQVELSGDNKKALYVPKGLAHGYQVLENNTVVIYLSDNVYSQKHYLGIRWDSFGMKWPITKPIVSDKDRGLPKLTAFKSPFKL